jgi:hypothetical protein
LISAPLTTNGKKTQKGKKRGKEQEKDMHGRFCACLPALLSVPCNNVTTQQRNAMSSDAAESSLTRHPLARSPAL